MLSSIWKGLTSTEIMFAEATPAIALDIQQLPLGSQIPKEMLDWTARFEGSVGALKEAVSKRQVDLPPDVPGMVILDNIIILLWTKIDCNF